jgi:hypothetical protein
MEHARFFPFLLVAALGACSAAPHRDPALSTNQEIITLDEIQASRGYTVYDVIQKVHANFLSYRGRTSIRDTTTSMPMVFMDDQVYGPVSVLRDIQASQISEIRLYRAWEAVIKYGTGLPGGAIALYSRLDK